MEIKGFYLCNLPLKRKQYSAKSPFTNLDSKVEYFAVSSLLPYFASASLKKPESGIITLIVLRQDKLRILAPHSPPLPAAVVGCNWK